MDVVPRSQHVLLDDVGPGRLELCEGLPVLGEEEPFPALRPVVLHDRRPVDLLGGRVPTRHGDAGRLEPLPFLLAVRLPGDHRPVPEHGDLELAERLGTEVLHEGAMGDEDRRFVVELLGLGGEDADLRDGQELVRAGQRKGVVELGGGSHAYPQGRELLGAGPVEDLQGRMRAEGRDGRRPSLEGGETCGVGELYPHTDAYRVRLITVAGSVPGPAALELPVPPDLAAARLGKSSTDLGVQGPVEDQLAERLGVVRAGPGAKAVGRQEGTDGLLPEPPGLLPTAGPPSRRSRGSDGRRAVRPPGGGSRRPLAVPARGGPPGPGAIRTGPPVPRAAPDRARGRSGTPGTFP